MAVGENSGFCKLLKSLSEYIDDTGLSKDVSEELEEVKKSLFESKRYYFQTLTLYTEIKNLLRENSYGLHDEKYEDHQNDNVTMHLLSETFFANEAKQCLNISLKPTNEMTEQLFGLSTEDFEYNSAQKKLLHQNIQQSCIPVLENMLKLKSLSIYRFCVPSCQESEGITLAKANQLATSVSNDRQKLTECKNSLREIEEEYKKLIQQQHQAMSGQIVELQESIARLHEKSNSETTQVTVDWLAAKCEYILTKITVMKNHLYDETYTNEAIDALSKIRLHLDEEIQRTQNELSKTKQSLNMYESIGGQFTDLLNQYRKITIQIDNKKWALSELQKNG